MDQVIHKFTDEVDGSGDEEEKERDIIGRRFVIMKSLIAVLMGVVIMLLVFSCATVPTEPLTSGELRLLSIDVLGSGIKANASFAVNIFFEAAGNPEIKRACFYESGEEPSCFDVSYLTLGTKRAFQVYLPDVSVGSHRVECYAEYIRDGETRKTNMVFIQILAGTHS